MANVIRDILEGFNTYLSAQLEDLEIKNGTISPSVKMSYRDERSEISSYPSVTFMLWDMTPGTDRQFSGLIKTVADNPDDTDQLIATPLPIPVDFYFQIDSFCELFDHHWAVIEKLQRIMKARHASFTTPDSKTYYIYPTTSQPIPDPEMNIHRWAFRFYVNAWLSSPLDTETLFKVITPTVTMNTDQYVEA